MKNIEINTLFDYVAFLIATIITVIIVTIAVAISFWPQIIMGILLALAIKSIIGA
jgi:hypothetical protein|nr:MAG TPA: hypothetical protein [Caudoviricetes sp.]